MFVVFQCFAMFVFVFLGGGVREKRGGKILEEALL